MHGGAAVRPNDAETSTWWSDCSGKAVNVGKLGRNMCILIIPPMLRNLLWSLPHIMRSCWSPETAIVLTVVVIVFCSLFNALVVFGLGG